MEDAAPAATRARPLLLAVVALAAAVVIVLAAPSSPLDGVDASSRFEVVLPGRDGIAATQLHVIDHARVVTDAVVESAFRPDGVSVELDNPKFMTLTWMGGMCDTAATMTIDGTAMGLTIAISTQRGSSCHLAGVGRAVELVLNRAIAAEDVQFSPD